MRRLKPHSPVLGPLAPAILGALLTIGAAPSVATAQSCGGPEALAEIRSLRLAGTLSKAIQKATEELRCQALTAEARVELHLELASAHDRYALHHNSRPAERALQQIQAAESVAEDAGARARGLVEFAKGDYYYRAEPDGGDFARSLGHLDEAVRLLEEAGDARSQAEAVRLQGLVRLRQGKLNQARRLIDRSLELQGKRPSDLFLGEYHRHIGAILLRERDREGALTHLRDSLEYRRKAGATDPALFAALTLGSTLLRDGRPEEAREHLLYALLHAQQIESPVGTARAAAALGDMYTRLGDPAAAQAANELAMEQARAVGLESVVRDAEEALEGLDSE